MKFLEKYSKLLFFIFFSFVVFSANAQKINSKNIAKMIEKSPEQTNSFTGFALYDLQEKKMIAEYNSNRYFIPASNTKLVSFYAGLEILGDSLPALKYYVENDTLFFTGSGDPSFLNFDIHTYNPVYDFLAKRTEKLCYLEGAYTSDAYGVGWAYDDYNEYFQPERTNFPIYGNILRFEGDDKGNYSFLPRYFKPYFIENKQVQRKYTKVERAVAENKFQYFPLPYKKFEQDVPFKTSTDLMLKLLSDTLNKAVFYSKTTPQRLEKLKKAHVLKSIPVDSLYKQMLYVSDNFMAEQVLLMCSFTMNDSLNTDFAIRYTTQKYLADLPDKLRWVDGSGLSRYNLFSPRDFVFLLEKICKKRTIEQLYNLMPVGGVSGTIKNYYKADKPYIIAKTGTLSNNHSLSGFLITKKGKVLIFSFMNNHYLGSASGVKEMMTRILWHIHLNY